MPEVSSAHKNQFTEAALLLLDVLAQAYVSWPIRAAPLLPSIWEEGS